jgi:uncharacterized BrkB/YihY/UPF0761 family membrane protein
MGAEFRYGCCLTWLMHGGYTTVWLEPLSSSFGTTLTEHAIDVITEVYPIPRTVLNRKGSSFTGFTVMMFLWGYCLTMINAAVSYLYWIWYRNNRWRQSTATKRTWDLFTLFVAFPAFVFIIIMPFTGGWIVTPLVQQVRSNPSTVQRWDRLTWLCVGRMEPRLRQLSYDGRS